jgi:cytoskeletal protein CcmA (bactofilin family)
LSNLTSAFKRRKSDLLEIEEYHIGSIRAESPVVVSSGAILAGDVLAPEVVVSGLVYGYVACRRLSVLPGGHIWGDVYLSSLEMAPEGKINGWISTLDAGTVDLLRAGELGEGDLPSQGDAPLPAELLQEIQKSGADVEADQKLSQRRSGIWRQLRSEAALALMARSEIEATFRQRLNQELAESAAENAELREALREAVAENEPLDKSDPSPVTHSEDSGNADHEAQSNLTEVKMLQSQLRKATAAAQKYYGELLWTRAALRAARHEEKDS